MVVGSKSSSDEKAEFQPIYRSGSCAEIGPKQYMEDEHICVDNLIEQLGSVSEIPSHGAFYGVSVFYLCLTSCTLAFDDQMGCRVCARSHDRVPTYCFNSNSDCSLEQFINFYSLFRCLMVMVGLMQLHI